MGLNPSVPHGRTGSASLTQALDEAVTADELTVATLPDAADYQGKIAYVSDGAAGDACLAYSNGTDWLRITLGAAVAAE